MFVILLTGRHIQRVLKDGSPYYNLSIIVILNLNNKNIFAFSDTHGNHRKLQVPENVDIVICAGDAVEDNLVGDEYDDFIEWFSTLPCKWKIFVPGNHELSFVLGQADGIVQRMKEKGITVLEDAIEDCDGVIIASISDNSSISDEDIPDDIDIVVTHNPPFGILDENMGSVNILDFILKAKPKYHLFGHIHSTAGENVQFGETKCINIA